jgi:hypothetical protein
MCIIFMTVDNRIKEELLHQFLFLWYPNHTQFFTKKMLKYKNFEGRLDCSLRNNQGNQHNINFQRKSSRNMDAQPNQSEDRRTLNKIVWRFNSTATFLHEVHHVTSKCHAILAKKSALTIAQPIVKRNIHISYIFNAKTSLRHLVVEKEVYPNIQVRESGTENVTCNIHKNKKQIITVSKFILRAFRKRCFIKTKQAK